ncbi:McbB family protein [Pseudomonas cedrina]|uniref:Microcin B17-processing protein McbB n=2 Tax=Pseudomonas cedrina TaxID=651740 RepID=A0A1V2KEW6_PSECE|nr:McbB family protein [Pseudomonas cedrina]ONH56040.1 microcin B17-processing protein McbB [Pseudomonas cedrina subsp. cedrina]SDT03010.1 McbB family protein [Pseudomonas cedrina]
MNIIIPNYEILNLDKESLVVSDVGISKIHSEPLLNVLRKLKLSNVMTKVELDEVLAENGLVQNDAFEFLEKIIPFKCVEEMYFEKTIIIHDWKGKVDVEELFRGELPGCLEFKSFKSGLVDPDKTFRFFIVLLCYSYDYESVKNLYFDLARASPKSAICVCWQMGSVFCIGQPYIPEIGNPCHFCAVDRLINNEAIMPAKNNWSSILSFCRNRQVGIPANALSLYQEMIVVGAVSKKIRFFTEHSDGFKYQDNVLHSSYLQLVDGQVFEESNSHWYMCDCLRADG